MDLNINELINASIQEVINNDKEEEDKQEVVEEREHLISTNFLRIKDPKSNDAGVGTYLGHALKRTGQAMGIGIKPWESRDKEAASAGVATHLGRAGARTLNFLTQEHPNIAGGTLAAIAAGLGALALRKKLRKGKGAKK